MLSFDAYQEATAGTAIYPYRPFLSMDTPTSGVNGRTDIAVPIYPFLGLAEEAGEVMGKIKKAIRDGHSYETVRANVEAELGDVLWYVARCAHHFNIPLSDIAQNNLVKLNKRKDNNTLRGSGDNR